MRDMCAQAQAHVTGLTGQGVCVLLGVDSGKVI